MDKVLVNHIGAVNLGIHLWYFVQSMAAGLDEERHESKLCFVFFEEQVLVFAAQRNHGGHVDLIIGGQHGGIVLGVFQALGNGGAEPGHLDAFFRSRAGHHAATAGQVVHDIALGQTPAAPRGAGPDAVA